MTNDRPPLRSIEQEREFIEKKVAEIEATAWYSPTATEDQKQRSIETSRQFAKRLLYPQDMGFHPLSDKFCEGLPVKAPWLRDYVLYRNLHRRDGLSRQDFLDYLSEAGADASDLADRCRGALLGLALGDTLGMPLEFSARDSRHVSGLEAGGPFNLKVGQWTDDTSMACCLAYSLISCEGFNPEDQLLCYYYWYRYGAYSPTGECFDIGATTRDAIERFVRTREPYCGSTDPRTAGNGSLMRLAPVPVFYADAFEEAVHYAGMSSRTTHQAVEAVDACRYFGALLHGALNGVPKAALLDQGAYSPIPGYWDAHPLAPAIAAIANGSFRAKSRDQIASTGYAVHTLEAALWAFYHHDSFEQAVLAAVNLADDSDTVGAVCGQIAGAYWGETRLPIEWILKTASLQGFYHFAQDLVQARETGREMNDKDSVC